MGDDARLTLREALSRAERALRKLRDGNALEAVKLAKHPDVDGLYALCVTQFGLPPNHGETGTELLLSHVVEKVPCFVSKIRLAKGGHSDDLLKLSCDDFCRLDFAACDAEPPALPIIDTNPKDPSITWNGTRHPVSCEWAEAFKMMLKAQPERIGLGDLIGGQPGRKLKALPAELRAIIDHNRKGGRLTV